ncbi:hypothetical protein FH972_007725 [Carpinus fangiana]|uniref:Uncharacterized protein n=1 Tax=Carpinus fangiana TaxID=176857 RepID=A0A5N6QZ67_9ROSI|nr:hypothetical protein FH972_007725 [Carpinus fangiana]
MDDEKALFPISTLDGSDDMLSSSSGQLSSTNSISRVTIMSNEEQSFASDQDSGKWTIIMLNHAIRGWNTCNPAI